MIDTNEEKRDERIKVEVTQDKMLGVVTFTAGEDGGERLDLKVIKEAIEKSGIVKGLMVEEIEALGKSYEYDHHYIIAKGKQPVNGQDGTIALQFNVRDLRELHPRINEDGTADLRDLGAVKNVRKGDILAIKTPALPGEDGYNVLGQVIRAKQGREARMPMGKNTGLSEDGMALIAQIDGKLEYDDHNVYVNAVYHVRGDLDNSIGNIDFVGDVIIYGSISSGLEIKAGGSVEVKGPVDDAIITAGKDIILEYGIQGNGKSSLIAGGNIATKFIQNATVEAAGSITTEAIVHSVVMAEDSVIVDMGKGSIVGGSVAAVRCINARSVGSPMGTVTILQIGMPPKAYTAYRQLANEIKEKKENLNKVDQSLKFLLSKIQEGQLDERKKIMLERLQATRKPLYDEYEELQQHYKALGEKLNSMEKGSIKVAYKLYPGVRIMSGSQTKYIERQYEAVTLKRENDDIVIE